MKDKISVNKVICFAVALTNGFISYVFMPVINDVTRIMALIISVLFLMNALFYCVFFCNPEKMPKGSWRIAWFVYAYVYRKKISRAFTQIYISIILILLIFTSSYTHIDAVWFPIFSFMMVLEFAMPLIILNEVIAINEDEISSRRKRDGIKD